MKSLLFLTTASALLFAACNKSRSLEERWLEKSQRQEVIVFRDNVPASGVDALEDRSFYFQSRTLPPEVSRANESGVYFYSISGDSLLLKTRQEKFYFRMSADGRSFTIGRFFVDPGGLGDLLTFEKQ
jgi:hypothetical protein